MRSVDPAKENRQPVDHVGTAGSDNGDVIIPVPNVIPVHGGFALGPAERPRVPVQLMARAGAAARAAGKGIYPEVGRSGTLGIDCKETST